jgi:hypothetical protein
MLAFIQINPENKDLLVKSQFRLTKTESFRNRTLSQNQFSQTMRLSQPKSIKIPPPM